MTGFLLLFVLVQIVAGWLSRFFSFASISGTTLSALTGLIMCRRVSTVLGVDAFYIRRDRPSQGATYKCIEAKVPALRYIPDFLCVI